MLSWCHFPLLRMPHGPFPPPREDCCSRPSTCHPMHSWRHTPTTKALYKPGKLYKLLYRLPSQLLQPQSNLYLQELSRNHYWRNLGPKTGGRLWPAPLLPQLVHFLGGEVFITRLLSRQVRGVSVPFRVVAGGNADPGLPRR